MTEREMTAKRLEYCVEKKCDICQKENGSGFPWIAGRCYGFTERLHDAIVLLKAQEPRVYTISDFYGEEFGYLEYRTDRPGLSNFEPSPVLIGDIDEENVTVVFRSASVQKLPLDKMNKNWRIWSDYPTHELLRAVKWE